jgi:hypothetical protein
MAHDFWNWFQTAPHSESRDSDCEAKLTELLQSARDQAIEECVVLIERMQNMTHDEKCCYTEPDLIEDIRALKLEGK